MSFSIVLRRMTATVMATGGIFFGGMVMAGAAEAAYDPAVWDKVAQCESSGNWSINTGNGYYGGLQFSYSTWKAYGGQQYAKYPHQATKAEQIAIARRTLAGQGPGAWPVCSKRAGLTKENGGADRNATPVGTPQQPAPKKPSTGGKLVVDGILGPRTIEALQRWVGASPDGIWGSRTTRALQSKVGATVDGVKGPETTRKTQQEVGATVDGKWGRETTRKVQEHLNDR